MNASWPRHMMNKGAGAISHSLVGVKYRLQKNGLESAPAAGSRY